MVKVIIQTVTRTEIDTETGKSRVVQHYSTPIGKGSKMQKKVKKTIELVPEESEVVYLN